MVEPSQGVLFVQLVVGLLGAGGHVVRLMYRLLSPLLVNCHLGVTFVQTVLRLTRIVGAYLVLKA